MLLVEDSRYANDAIRLMCRHLGLRMRRADSLQSAWRHLAHACPNALLIDMGLPDGSGLTLLQGLRTLHPRPAALLAISGDPGLKTAALAAGADGFIEKPLASLAAFEAILRGVLPPCNAVGNCLPLPKGGDRAAPRPTDACAAPAPAPVAAHAPAPDRLAYFDDLHRARLGLAKLQDARSASVSPAAGTSGRVAKAAGHCTKAHAAYLAQFVRGLARSTADPALERAARALPPDPRRGAPQLTQLFQLVEERLRDRPPI